MLFEEIVLFRRCKNGKDGLTIAIYFSTDPG